MTPDKLIKNMELAPFTSLRTGGRADYFCKARSVLELTELLSWADSQAHPVSLLGGGSNSVYSDQGWRGLVIQLGLMGIHREKSPTQAGDDVLVSAAAGESWDAFASHCVDQNLAGIECLSGIPGQVGATPIQNVGAYGQEVSQVIDQVTCLERASQRICTFSGEQCDFGYRSSRFKTTDRGRYIVTSVRFRLIQDGKPALNYPDLQKRLSSHSAPTLQQTRRAVLEARASKSMLLSDTDPNGRSCGSFFVNPILSKATFNALVGRLGVEPPAYPQPDGQLKLPAAWLIEQAGIKRGYRRGTVGVSTRHTLCLVCHEGATSAELLSLARQIKETVQTRLAITLTMEPMIIGPEASTTPSV